MHSTRSCDNSLLFVIVDFVFLILSNYAFTIFVPSLVITSNLHNIITRIVFLFTSILKAIHHPLLSENLLLCFVMFVHLPHIVLKHPPGRYISLLCLLLFPISVVTISTDGLIDLKICFI